MREEASQGAPGRPPGYTPPPTVVRVEVSMATITRIVVVLAGVWLLGQLVPVILVLVAALFLVGTLSPVIEWLEARRVRRGLAITLVFTALVIATVLVIALTIPELIDQVKNLQAQEPAWRKRAVEWLARSPLTAPMAEALRTTQFVTLVDLTPASALAFSTRIGEFFAYSMAAIFLALYGLIDRDRLRGALFSVIPREHHMRLSRILLNLETIVGGYIRGQLLTSVLMGVFMFVLLGLCGVPNALALAVFGGAADVLPYIGPFLTIGPAVAASLARGPVVVGVVLVLMIIYEEFESRVLIPVVYGRALRLPSSVVMFSLLVGASLMGIIGALIALPVAAALLMLVDELRFELPGEPTAAEGNPQLARDVAGEQQYADLTDGMPAQQAAAIAVGLADERKREDAAPPAVSADPDPDPDPEH
jgi:predicted PurR-regulated permease PerM